jgi:hypothetical protein
MSANKESNNNTSNNSDSIVDQLTKLSQLSQSGAITPEEFATLKARLLGTPLPIDETSEKGHSTNVAENKVIVTKDDQNALSDNDLIKSDSLVEAQRSQQAQTDSSKIQKLSLESSPAPAKKISNRFIWMLLLSPFALIFVMPISYATQWLLGLDSGVVGVFIYGVILICLCSADAALLREAGYILPPPRFRLWTLLFPPWYILTAPCPLLYILIRSLLLKSKRK